ncbi:tetratricopeptide repeat protein [Cyanobium sp. Cruz CV13-4-11]|uniref:tetratricopeptide repeat protein n=1 Tax=unclassified Cyanobium TaxID=2627006 RepID=UPI0020CE784A|nr:MULTISPECIES: tetratricopeptide repeat protein [unclassified Cyanobium]MCP9902042.1 tetratricopeptide repeat protein [Cyanobium sp. Cruz CV11-17]MCP9920880.1 tetratricopeptide repeat protein [Cyanobium sp. Cruz CV13-4-11]
MGRRFWRLFSSLCLALPLTVLPTPAKALVPFVYLPQEKELEGAGLGIAQAAARLLRLGQAEDAARLAELTVRLLPDDPRGWVLLAEAELRSNQMDKAVVALARAKQLDPNNAGIWFAEGSLALRNGKPQDAISLLRKGIELDGKNAGAYFDLGNAQILLGNTDAALGSFEKAAGLRKDFWEAINNQGLVLFERGRTADAIGRWQRVLKIKPDIAETSLALAAALFERGPAERAQALKLAESALAEEPNYVMVSFQKEQLWGPRLRAVTAQLLALPELKAAVERAQANATAGDGNGGSSDDS